MVDESAEQGPPRTLLDVATTERDDVVIVSLTGELDMTTADRAALALQNATDRADAVVVDMTGVRFFSSAGLNLLLQLHEAVRAKQVAVHLAGDQRAVARPLELTGLGELFPMHATVDAAVAGVVADRG